MRVLITGGSGFIGSAIVARLLARGDTITALTRRVPANETRAGLRWALWEPERDGAWQSELDGQDAVIHLAGSQAVGKRYTKAVREEIWNSRVESTKRVVAGMGRVAKRPHVLVCASGVGYYGARDATPVDESAPAGEDFLAQLCVAWEAAARGAEQHGARVVSGRIGYVLGRGGGALAKLVPIFKAGIGGKLGSGQQMQSWIHLDDVAGAFVHALDEARLSGPMNVAAPNAVSNAELSKELARALHRPALIPAPSCALRLLFGEGAEPILTGQAAVPRALLASGYQFRFTELRAALADLLSDTERAARRSSAGAG
jgi:uncharacterized protein (TIGR01777 family)